MRTSKQRGATLLELLLAVVIVVILISSLALLLPKASTSVTNNRQRIIASNLADSKIQEFKDQPYALIPVTPSGSYFILAAPMPAGGPGCDCNSVNWSNLSSAVTPENYTEDGMTYTLQTCVNLVEHNTAPPPDWNSYCPDYPLTPTMDKNLKSIHVHLTWTSQGTVHSLDTESLVSR